VLAHAAGVDHLEPVSDGLAVRRLKLEVAAMRGYLSLRRRKQFAMLQPSTTGRLDLGLVLPDRTEHMSA
jgi:hypothetical protein